MWWVGFKTITWIGEGGEPTWYETFPGEAKRGFCPTCGSRVAAIDNTSGEDLVPIHASFHDNAVRWLPSVAQTEPSATG
ncbi:aldehyde-activating protein [Streptomyces sp. OE57]|uniref:aldehyde-activating protein n=1 Tax=Streptomyces lacaronensis TaxID=3379885 RepID=UPI0039B760E6